MRVPKQLRLLFVTLVAILFACENRELVFDYRDQLELDRREVYAYLEANSIHAEESPNGLWYQVLNKGEDFLGCKRYDLAGMISMMDGTAFEVQRGDRVSEFYVYYSNISSCSEIFVNDFLPFVNEAADLVNVGGELRMFVPSWLAYKNKVHYQYGSVEDGSSGLIIIPPNSNLIFEGVLVERD
ncbi:hypothetical protein [Roseivirga pacifica]|nr:hypothetical protein [Roseivirga pacifica]MCO6359977.1 hypothetical protein [Roseivirga pacifica]MCO6370122.1 hypothetical protein [Roseivirga pacifica]MCO6375004.1 hypothetical protein [Roseivirga pacifica]MCO6380262.1 hypothetical protein [Roseivirga pacifica]